RPSPAAGPSRGASCPSATSAGSAWVEVDEEPCVTPPGGTSDQILRQSTRRPTGRRPCTPPRSKLSAAISYISRGLRLGGRAAHTPERPRPAIVLRRLDVPAKGPATVPWPVCLDGLP